ncbi:MAG: twin arginine translocase protein A [bacterium ADurb.Bin236]|nr:MAG: twin arginine translocase protein A [bacterium ADurb.Bin236]HOY63514.1 twin-arginine translocase TatA/TatE family subunit [bacterium]HPN94138.1 twin-arginine translocase TatA/TatE family subunit [bacterium]
MFGRLGPLEIAIIAIVAILIFGPARIGSLARSVGGSYFKVRHEIDQVKKSVTTDVVESIKESGSKPSGEASKTAAAAPRETDGKV